MTAQTLADRLRSHVAPSRAEMAAYADEVEALAEVVADRDALRMDLRRVKVQRDEALVTVARVEALAGQWEARPKPTVGWDSGLSATEGGNRLGVWNVLQSHADDLRAALDGAP